MKKWLRVFIVVVFAALAVLTFVSRTVYNRNLPQVSAITARAGHVPIATDVVGLALPIAHYNVAVGSIVEVDRMLVLYDTSAHEFEVRALEIAIARWENALYAGEALAEAELALAQDRLAWLTDRTPPRFLTTPVAGRVVSIDTPPNFPVRFRIENQGAVMANIVPRGALFASPHWGYVVYAIGTRRGLFGAEYYVRAVSVNVLRENDQFVAIHATNDDRDAFGIFTENTLAELTLAYNIDGFVSSGATVWVR